MISIMIISYHIKRDHHNHPEHHQAIVSNQLFSTPFYAPVFHLVTIALVIIIMVIMTDGDFDYYHGLPSSLGNHRPDHDGDNYQGDKNYFGCGCYEMMMITSPDVVFSKEASKSRKRDNSSETGILGP